MKKATGNILAQLRGLMKNSPVVTEPIQAYIIPSSDKHQNEYLRDCDKRRDYVSGFTGSAGTAIVTESNALLWTDGRYYLQAVQEMDENWTLMKEGLPTTPTQEVWLTKTLPSGSRVGADPWLLSSSKWNQLQTSLEAEGHCLVPILSNLIDIIWTSKPTEENNPVIPLDVKYTGRTCAQKLEEIRTKMKEQSASVLILTALDEIAWVLNLRGKDIPFNPVFFAFAAITESAVHLFIDESKLNREVTNHFKSQSLSICIYPYNKVEEHLIKFVEETRGKIWLNKGSSQQLHSCIPKSRVITDVSPISLMKATKNDTEAKGLKECHIRDAAALCCYFSWLEKNVNVLKITEISGADKLEELRSEQEDYMGLSFPTISAVGSNAAIIHYTPSEKTDKVINDSELYLCDSGGQYRDGTTDVTRTLHFGVPTDFEKECFTRVLRGQIALATAVFPSLIKGNALDSFARQYLWEVGLEYGHGTGHGIGHFLNVHEGPMGISYRTIPDDPGLQKNMFLSNEPGCYLDGKFGIRIENIEQIVEAGTPHNFNDRGYLKFETITLVPIQQKMINVSLLTANEIDFLNKYHQKCRDKVGALLKNQKKNEALQWLMKETEPLIPIL